MRREQSAEHGEAHRRAELDRLMAALRGADRGQQLAALRALAKAPDLQQGPALLALLTEPTTPPALGQELFHLLANAKVSSLVPAVGAALAEANTPHALQLLLQLCWQSPLDFSPLLPQLVPLIAHEDLQVQIEAVTSVRYALDRCPAGLLEQVVAQLTALRKQKPEKTTDALLAETLNAAKYRLSDQSGSAELDYQAEP